MATAQAPRGVVRDAERRMAGVNHDNGQNSNGGEHWVVVLGKIVLYGVLMWALASMFGSYDPSRALHAKISDALRNSTNTTHDSSSVHTSTIAIGNSSHQQNASSLMPLAREGDLFTLRIECSEPNVFEPVVFRNLPFNYTALSKAKYHVNRSVNLSTLYAHNRSANVLLTWHLRGHSFSRAEPLLRYFPSTQTTRTRYFISSSNGTNSNSSRGSSSASTSESERAVAHDEDVGHRDKYTAAVAAEPVAYTASIRTEFAISPVMYFNAPIQTPFMQFTPRVPHTALYGPAVVVDNFWLLQENMNEVNESAAQKPFSVTFRVTPLQGWKMLIYTQLDQLFRQQQDMGLMKSSDTDDVKRIFLDNNPYFLLLTMLVSLLHMVFEYLAFANDVQFWRGRKDLRGFSVRSIVLNCYFQSIIFLYLLDTHETSWTILMPSGVGVLTEFWKLTQTIGVRRVDDYTLTDEQSSDAHLAGQEQMDAYNGPNARARTQYPSMTDNERLGQRVVRDILQRRTSSSSSRVGNGCTQYAHDGLRIAGYVIYFSKSYDRRTRKHDDTAVRYLIYAMMPILACYSVYSALYDTHTSWYAYVIHTQVRFIYFFGFAMMTPQIFINYKLKSVGNLPWRTFVYKALNTVIDDLFAFVVKMPWLHRLACFRDDVVFVILLYQRWIYPVDVNRVAGSDGDVIAGDDEDETDADGERAKDTVGEAHGEVKKAQ